MRALWFELRQGFSSVAAANFSRVRPALCSCQCLCGAANTWHHQPSRRGRKWLHAWPSMRPPMREHGCPSHGRWQVALDPGGSPKLVCGSDAQPPVTLPAVVPVDSEVACALSTFQLAFPARSFVAVPACKRGQCDTVLFLRVCVKSSVQLCLLCNSTAGSCQASPASWLGSEMCAALLHPTMFSWWCVSSHVPGTSAGLSKAWA